MSQPADLPPPPPAVPGSVTAASVITLVCSVSALVFLLLFVAILGPALSAAAQAFGGNLTEIGVATTVGLGAWTIGAGVCAWLVMQRNGTARWVLLVLAGITVPVGAFLAYYVLPAVAALAALAVIVLLCRRESRAWFAA